MRSKLNDKIKLICHTWPKMRSQQANHRNYRTRNRISWPLHNEIRCNLHLNNKNSLKWLRQLANGYGHLIYGHSARTPNAPPILQKKVFLNFREVASRVSRRNIKWAFTPQSCLKKGSKWFTNHSRKNTQTKLNNHKWPEAAPYWCRKLHERGNLSALNNFVSLKITVNQREVQ